jgi:hypothetical protein
MGEEIRPTGITYEDAMDAAQRGGGIDFEGRKARIVHLSQKSGRDTPHSARIELDLGDRYLALFGYFSRDGEFMEEGRECPFGKAT